MQTTASAPFCAQIPTTLAAPCLPVFALCATGRRRVALGTLAGWRRDFRGGLFGLGLHQGQSEQSREQAEDERCRNEVSELKREQISVGRKDEVRLSQREDGREERTGDN